MLNHIKLFLLFFILHSSFVAQVNLVLNPSFEVYSACPTNTGGDVDKATGWDTCRGSADYFHTCGSSSLFQIPKNYFGYQQALNGNAYCGIFTYTPSGFYRELIIGQLVSPLMVSQKYYVSFKVNRADSNYVIGYSTNKIGVKMSVSKQNNVPINNTAHYFSNSVITDTLNWTKLSGSFIADSAYQYIMIGNFFDDGNISIINDGNGNNAYYYVDEICLSTDSLFTENYSTKLESYVKEKYFELLPNPADNFFMLKNVENGYGSVFTNQGLLITDKLEIKGSVAKIDCTTWPAGLYFIQIAGRRYKVNINH